MTIAPDDSLGIDQQLVLTAQPLKRIVPSDGARFSPGASPGASTRLSRLTSPRPVRLLFPHPE